MVIFNVFVCKLDWVKLDIATCSRKRQQKVLGPALHRLLITIEGQKRDTVLGKCKTTRWTSFDSDIFKFCGFKFISSALHSWKGGSWCLARWGDSHPVIRDMHYRQLIGAVYFHRWCT